MMSKYKKILFVYILLLVLGGSFFIPHLIFKIKQSYVRKEIKKAIKSGIPKTEMICFTEDDIKNAQWEKPQKEFWLNGELFDIVKKEISNGITYYWCINDHQEKELFATLDNLVNKQMNEKDYNPVKKNIVFWLFCQYFPIEFNVSDLFYHTLSTAYFLKHYSADIYLIPPPPPEQV